MVVTSAYTLWGKERNQVSAHRGRNMLYFLGGKTRDAFGQPAFFLTGNRVVILK